MFKQNALHSPIALAEWVNHVDFAVMFCELSAKRVPAQIRKPAVPFKIGK
ncbi:hypothetical protein PAERUG_E15_London_28_01_14_02356 [Pseudomonas aeruginosa]|nr:hypothetical protein PAERUG_E15_London_28_01_14_02356 [Pseudomonas aeruginosa]